VKKQLKTHVVAFRLTPEMWELLQRARKKGLNFSQVCRESLSKAVKEVLRGSTR